MRRIVMVTVGIALIGILSSENAVEKKQQYLGCSANKKPCSVLVNLNSACVRCETCLAIANQIGRTLSMLREPACPESHFNESHARSVITFICDHSFENFGLKELNDKRAIADHTPAAKSILTDVDEIWATHLKQRCRELTEVLTAATLYETWKLSRADAARQSSCDWTKLETDLCRQENAFLRDCRGIPSAERCRLVSHKHERLARQIANLIQREKMFS